MPLPAARRTSCRSGSESAASIERKPILRELSGMTVVLPLLLLLSSPEAASQEPLLVVVESSGGVAVDASALRAAIARELGVRVLSPTEEERMEGVAILTVALASREAVITFRREGATVRRAV